MSTFCIFDTMSQELVKTNHLFFFTSEFPFGKAETFIETEILYLSKSFKNITIITHDILTISRRKIPKNVKVLRLRYPANTAEKIFSLRFLFRKIFWNEVKLIHKKLNLNIDFGRIKTLLVSLQNATRLKAEYLKVLDILQYSNEIYYSYWLNDSALALSMLKSEHSNKKFISKMHRWDIYFEENKYGYLPMRSFMLNSLDCVYSISADGIRYTKSLFSSDFPNLKLSKLGIKEQIVENQPKLNKFMIVSCSNVIDVKRVQLIAESISFLKIQNLNWTHFGDGFKLSELLNFCNAKLKNKVNFNFPGRVSNDEVIKFYKKHHIDLFINLSSSEGIPVSIMEAMSFGIPVIATNVGGTSEIVNINNGYLLSPNPLREEVAEVISSYNYLNLEEKIIKRQAAFKTWKDEYNAEKNYTSFIKEITLL